MGTCFVYISGWKEHGGAPGIGLLRFDTESGRIEPLGKQQEELSCNCTALDWERRILYITNEVHANPDYPKGGGGLVYAFRIDENTGDLTQLSRVESCCPCPAYLTLDAKKQFLLCANHSSFNAVTRAALGADGYWHTEVLYDDALVGLFRLNADGSIGPLIDVHKHDAYPVRGRGLHAHPHTAVMSPDGSLFACCDKGDAHIYMYRIDRARGKLTLASEPYADEPGSAPRYCAFHPTKPYFYINHERDMRVCAFLYDADGRLTPINATSALLEGLPQGDTPAVRSALHGTTCPLPADGFMPLEQQGFVIHPSGKYLYDMLNGADAVSVFAIDQGDGSVARVQTMPVEGRWVRGCALSPDGRFLLVTCLQSGDVYVYPIAPDGQLLSPVSHAVVPGGSYATFCG